MGAHPVNLALRFALELAALAAMGYGGYHLDPRVGVRWGLAIGLPLVAAVLWGVFAVPGDPSRSGDTVVATPGWLRLVLELAIFGAATWALAHTGARGSSAALGGLTLLHYAASYDRVWWLLTG